MQRLSEDNVLGKLTEDRFVKLSYGYEQEQKNLQELIAEPEQQIGQQERKAVSVERR